MLLSTPLKYPAITNTINGKKYVGQTIKHIEKILKEHFKAAVSEKRKSIICSANRNDITKQYGVSKGAINKIANRENWSHI